MMQRDMMERDTVDRAAEGRSGAGGADRGSGRSAGERRRALRLAGSATAMAAAVLLLAGCAGAAGESGSGTNSGSGSGTTNGGSSTSAGTTETSPSTAEIEQLITDGVLPEGFPKDATNVRLVQDGDRVAASWAGDRLTGSCSAASSSPGSFAMTLLIQDAGLEQVEQCGAVWQATQADGTHVLWNSEA